MAQPGDPNDVLVLRGPKVKALYREVIYLQRDNVLTKFLVRVNVYEPPRLVRAEGVRGAAEDHRCLGLQKQRRPLEGDTDEHRRLERGRYEFPITFAHALPSHIEVSTIPQRAVE